MSCSTFLISESKSGPSETKWSRDHSGDKKKNRNSSPVTFEQERDDAIAELDSVIDSYHSRGGGTVRRRPKHHDKNGGTWPKARWESYEGFYSFFFHFVHTWEFFKFLFGVLGLTNKKIFNISNLSYSNLCRGGPIIEDGTGTIVHPRKNKERLPLSVLLNNPPDYRCRPCCEPQTRRNNTPLLSST